MQLDQLVQSLDALDGVDASAADGTVRVSVPALDEQVLLPEHAIARFESVRSPTGDPAVWVDVRDADGVAPLIFTAGDIVFAPIPVGVLLDSRLPYSVADAPGLVAYSEVERDARTLRRSCETGAGLNLDGLAGTFLVLRSFIAGAIRSGLRPVRAVGWWEEAWRSMGDDVPLPPFRADPTWDELHAAALDAPLE